MEQRHSERRDSAEVLAATSTDGGASFEPSVQIADLTQQTDLGICAHRRFRRRTLPPTERSSSPGRTAASIRPAFGTGSCSPPRPTGRPGRRRPRPALRRRRPDQFVPGLAADPGSRGARTDGSRSPTTPCRTTARSRRTARGIDAWLASSANGGASWSRPNGSTLSRCSSTGCRRPAAVPRRLHLDVLCRRPARSPSTRWRRALRGQAARRRSWPSRRAQARTNRHGIGTRATRKSYRFVVTLTVGSGWKREPPPHPGRGIGESWSDARRPTTPARQPWGCATVSASAGEEHCARGRAPLLDRPGVVTGAGARRGRPRPAARPAPSICSAIRSS